MGDSGVGASAAGGSSSSALGGASQGVGGAIQLAGAYSQHAAFRRAGNYQNRIANINAQMSSLEAADAVKRGDQAASQRLNRGGNAVSDQRAVFARGGTDVNSGTAGAVQAGAQAVSQLDALTISHNAKLEAIGYNMQGINATAQGRMAAIAGKNNAAQSMITGGMKFAEGSIGWANNYYKYRPVVPVEQTSSMGFWNKGIQPGGFDQSTESQMGPEDF